ncbi:MAG: GAF domain-containing protein [Pseudomonadota bacterium]
MSNPAPTPERAAELLSAVAAADDPFPALDAALGEVIGHKLFTIMAIDWAAEEAGRVYTNMPDAYPVKGKKPLGTMTEWGAHVIEGQQPFIGYDAADIARVFPDHETIAALGCASVLNVPVIRDGRVIATLNLLHEAGFYAPPDAARATPFAEAVAPRL